MLKNITPLILTYNEAPNVARTLAKLNWANEIVVIDSFSTDETLEIIKTNPRVRVYQRKFDTHANQWNYGLEQITTDWVISLDADYVLSDGLIEEIKNVDLRDKVNSYFLPFKYCIFGKPLRGTILPPRQALFRKDCSTYIDDGHTQLLRSKGKTQYLRNYILHDDRKPLSRWLWAQHRYMVLEAKKLSEASIQELSLGDKVRKQKLLAPFVIFFYCLIIKGGILDGWIGWYYAFQRMLAEAVLSVQLIQLEQS